MTSRNERVSFVVSSEMKQKAQKIAKENGLRISEIARRGLIGQINQLED